MERKTVKKTLLAQKRIGRRLYMKKFLFEKVSIRKDSSGEIESELPYEQILYLFAHGRRSFWFTEDEFESLVFLIDMEWEEATPSFSFGIGGSGERATRLHDFIRETGHCLGVAGQGGE